MSWPSWPLRSRGGLWPPLILSWVLVLALLLGGTGVASADTIAVQRASLQADPAGGWNLDARFDFTLNSSLTDAVSKGIPLYFTTEFTLTRPRWYWLDQQAVSTSQSVRLSFQPLTREYRISSGGGLHLAVASLDQALAIIKHVTSWHVIDPDEVVPGQSYVAAVKMELDMAQMPKPFQIDAVNNRDWNLTSDWLHFNFNVIEHGK
ncbi:DUF4390 domain-containing protein [Robbsia betulipollinis]|uniref:DUF4390 domain-containing protein n=1 Tax=Robbsia betulipollinis TaxID=2981849 RepID=UPI003D7996CD